MKKILINRILNEYIIKESLVVDDSSYIDEIKQIELLSDTDGNLENKLDKIWNSLEIKSKKVIEFLEEGSKVTIQFKLKGREAKKKDIINGVAEKFYSLLKEKCIMNFNGESYILIPKS